jgi:hypothetical protein
MQFCSSAVMQLCSYAVMQLFSHDLAPSNIFFFGCTKTQLTDYELEDFEDLKASMEDILSQIYEDIIELDLNVFKCI